MAMVEPVGNYLVRTGALSEARVQTLMREVDAGGERILSVALRTGAAPERVLARALALQKGTPALVLSSSSLDLSALQLIPKVVATTHKVLPVQHTDDTLTVAVADVGDRAIFDQVAFATGLRVQPVLAVDAALVDAITAAYDAYADHQTALSGPNAIADATAGKPLLSLERPDVIDAANISEEVATVVEDPWPQLTEVVAVDLQGHDALPADMEINLDDVLESTDAPPEVLVVEDDEAVCGLLQRLLKHDGYEVVEVQNGRQALEYLKDHRPDLVLLDAMLPEVHGFEICRTLKTSPLHKDVPVIMVSAVYKGWQHARDIHEVYGADAFIEKPFDVNYLRASIGQFLGRVLERTRLSSEYEKRRDQLRYRADVAYRQGQFDDAKALLQQLRTLDPFDAASHLMLGNIAHRESKDFEQAMRHWEKAVRFDPDHFAAHKNLALALEHFGFHKRAIATWQRAAHLTDQPAVQERIRERLRRLSV